MDPRPGDTAFAILLVEDNWVNQQIAAKLMAQLEQPYDLATSGEDCLEKVQLRAYDLILLDIEMPGINGFETLSRLRAWESATGTRPSYVVACTAFSLSGHQKKCLTTGMDAYLAKPLKPELVAQVIAQCRADRE